MNRIYLIGYMGSGKSSVSRALAKSLGWKALDMDILIEERSGQAIANLFKHFGEGEFRKLETSVLHHLKGEEKVVVATGGGAPCFHGNMDTMLAEAIVIYLKVDVDQLVERIMKDGSVRPIVHEKTQKELKVFVQEHLQERASFYIKAHHIVDGNQSIDHIVQAIRSHVDVDAD